MAAGIGERASITAPERVGGLRPQGATGADCPCDHVVDISFACMVLRDCRDRRSWYPLDSSPPHCRQWRRRASRALADRLAERDDTGPCIYGLKFLEGAASIRRSCRAETDYRVDDAGCRPIRPCRRRLSPAMQRGRCLSRRRLPRGFESSMCQFSDS